MKAPGREWLKLIKWAAERGIEEVNRVHGDLYCRGERLLADGWSVEDVVAEVRDATTVRVSLRHVLIIANRRLAQLSDLEVPEAPGADRIAYDADQEAES